MRPAMKMGMYEYRFGIRYSALFRNFLLFSTFWFSKMSCTHGNIKMGKNKNCNSVLDDTKAVYLQKREKNNRIYLGISHCRRNMINTKLFGRNKIFATKNKIPKNQPVNLPIFSCFSELFHHLDPIC